MRATDSKMGMRKPRTLDRFRLQAVFLMIFRAFLLSESHTGASTSFHNLETIKKAATARVFSFTIFEVRITVSSELGETVRHTLPESL